LKNTAGMLFIIKSADTNFRSDAVSFSLSSVCVAIDVFNFGTGFGRSTVAWEIPTPGAGGIGIAGIGGILGIFGMLGMFGIFG
jgi:hypothetical protein